MDTTAVDMLQADFDAATELLRQAAIREGLLDAADRRPPRA